MKGYTIVYWPEFCGFTFVIRSAGRFVYQGWSLGSKKTAEHDARDVIASLQAKKAA